MECYIYFKTRVADEARVLAAEAQLQRLLLQHTGRGMALQRRPHDSEGLHTWMEIYHEVSPDWSIQLAELLAQTALPDLQYSGRHAEYFLNVDVCA